jgi:hypothetical protein
MNASIFSQILNLTGYLGHAEVSDDYQLLNNSTDQTPEVIAEVCGVIIGYFKAQASSSDPVVAVSVVHETCLYITHSIADGYLLVKFARSEDLSKLRESLSFILGHS